MRPPNIVLYNIMYMIEAETSLFCALKIHKIKHFSEKKSQEIPGPKRSYF